ncbi:MAG: aminotransferase class V-fold PLP-dependent enzyme [Thermomicrobiales bacterium]
MAEAARSFVRIDEVAGCGQSFDRRGNWSAGRVHVTSRASAGITLAVAASIAGARCRPYESATRHRRHGRGCHRPASAPKCTYDHAALLAGARLVEVGTSGFPGRGASWPWQVEAAITDRTTAILWPISDIPGVASLEEVCEIAHRHGLDVIVDAAAALPPVTNLRTFIDRGADAVIFSGGKAIRGPQSTGIVAGRADLIESIALQHQDMDVYPQTWSLRSKYLESGVLPGPPHHGIGRGFKVGKEEIIGLMVALERYLVCDHEAELAAWLARMNALASCVKGIASVSAEVFIDPKRPIPVLRLHLDESVIGRRLRRRQQLAEGEPPMLLSEGLRLPELSRSTQWGCGKMKRSSS